MAMIEAISSDVPIAARRHAVAAFRGRGQAVDPAGQDFVDADALGGVFVCVDLGESGKARPAPA